MVLLGMPLCIVFFGGAVRGQSISELNSHYSGQTEWDAASGVFTFTSSGTIDFALPEERDGIWFVPAEVQRIVINENVRVTGQFTVRSTMTVEGRDRYTSEMFGTPVRALLHDQGLDSKYGCWTYSTVYGEGNIDVYLKDFTCLNPVGFMFTGKQGARMHLDGVRGIDDRGGGSNHSDGVSAASGTTVRNCYFETGDDCIKVYANITVEDTTIKMVQNCVPIQLGWGSYGNNAEGTFENLTVTGTSGRGTSKGVIVATAGTYAKRITIDGCHVVNPNASLVILNEAGESLDLTIREAHIAVQRFAYALNGPLVSSICGTSEQRNVYDCRTAGLADLARVAGAWLAQDCHGADWCGGGDVDRDGRVDWRDVTTLGLGWLGGE